MLTKNQTLHQGRYRIVSQLGQNDSGISYEAFDTVSGVNVLLEEMRGSTGKVATISQIEARKAVFAKKAERLAAIKHELFLSVSDFFADVDQHYLIAELTDGISLSELLEKKKKPVPLNEVVRWMDNVLEALNYLHTQMPPIIHSELKPQNIKLLPNGKIKLLIFNLAKTANEKINSADSSQTFDAAVLPYLPLEQIWEGLDAASKKVILTDYDEKSERILEQPVDPRSDLYSLAATFYHLLTERAPIDALTRSIDILEGKPDPLVSPSQLNPLVPVQISDVLLRALKIKREERFSSVVIMRQVLRTANVRVKEIAAANKQKKSEDEMVLEIPSAEQKPSVPAVAPKNREIEAEHSRQLELIKKQLREAETRRLEAERRAAEAEKRLLEAEKHVSFDPAAADIKPAETLIEESKPLPEAAAAEKPVVEQLPAGVFENQADDFPELFAETPKESGAFKKAAAGVGALLILGGAGFGIWSFVQPKSPQAVQSAITNTAMPQPSAEATPAPAIETAPAQSSQPTAESLPSAASSNEADNPAASSPSTTGKTKSAVATPTPQTAQVKKPSSTPAKQTETPKKVTLDDLLKDN